jgi:hypothetical protein
MRKHLFDSLVSLSVVYEAFASVPKEERLFCGQEDVVEKNTNKRAEKK